MTLGKDPYSGYAGSHRQLLNALDRGKQTTQDFSPISQEAKAYMDAVIAQRAKRSSPTFNVIEGGNRASGGTVHDMISRALEIARSRMGR